MKIEDWRLLFETEKSILSRRIRQIFLRSISADLYRIATARGPLRQSSPEKPDPRKPRTSAGPAAGTPDDESVEEPEGTWFGPVAISGAVHLVLLLVVLPLLQSNSASKQPTKTLNLDTVRVHWRVAEQKPKIAPAPPVPVEQPPEEAPIAELPQTPIESTATPLAKATAPPNPLANKPPAEEKLDDTPAPSVLGVGSGSEQSGVGHGKLGERGSGKERALASYGGSADTEWAVSQGLVWLARHQDRNGSWDPAGFSRHCDGGPRCSGNGFGEFRVGLTALVTLAFLGSGCTGEEAKPHATVVQRALAFLLVSQDDSGCLGRDGTKFMYNHALATLCLSEAFLMTGDKRYRDAARSGLAFAAEAQQPGGGWDYSELRTLRNDLSVSGWLVMAMQIAREADVEFSPRMESEARRFVSRAVHPDGTSTYADSGVGEGRQGISIAAVGMLSKLYLGWSPRSHEIKRSAERLLRRPPRSEERMHWERHHQSSYYWYYATLAQFHVGGEIWEAWNSLLQREVLPLQIRSGEQQGSWDPDPNWIGAEGGRIATTALNVLSFEVYYRYKPLFKKYGFAPESGDDRDADPIGK